MRDICLARLDKVRPALVLTSPSMRGLLTNVTIAEITSTIRGLPTELLVGPANGLDRDSVVNLHNIHTVPVDRVLHVAACCPTEMSQHLLARSARPSLCGEVRWRLGPSLSRPTQLPRCPC